MAEKTDRPDQWTGRELTDANGRIMGTIAGPAFARRKFGTKWLLVDIGADAKVPVPLIFLRLVGDRLVLPYPRGYVEAGPTMKAPDELSDADQRRLGLHYGFDDELPGASSCCQTCGLCRAARLARQSASLDRIGDPADD